MATKSNANIARRQFLKASAGLVSTSLFMSLHGCNLEPNTLLIGGYQTSSNNYGIAAIDINGNSRWQLKAPERVHGPCIEAKLKLGAVAARRPGNFIQVFSAESGSLIEHIPRPQGIFFEGHAEFSAGRLWATAARESSCDALLLSWNVDQLTSPPDILSLPGIGPHQVLNHAGSLWIAIGGWKTDNRMVTNADYFESLLLEIDPFTFQIKAVDNPSPGLSLRHLAAYGDEIYVGMQYAYPRPSTQPLVYRYKNHKWAALAEPERGWEVFDGYIASVAASHSKIMATSPQGHHIGLWDRATLESLETEKILDGSAAINAGNQLFAASGVGVMMDAEQLSRRIPTEFHWDNHWTSYTPT